jgi:Glycosyltransferase family 10 (fucosyltransferase) C-term
MVSRKYKFYLALENSLCKDYVTEKFFRFLHRDVVVIALGAANYTQFVPRDTYIDVRDFRSPKDLASYLRLLDARNDKYEDYLMRKRSLRCRERYSESHQARLCRHLWDTLNTTQLADLSSSANAHDVCLSPRTFYRQVADMITH